MFHFTGSTKNLISNSVSSRKTVLLSHPSHKFRINMQFIKISLVLLITLFFIICNTSAFDSDAAGAVFGKIKSGFQAAGRFLGLDHASGVAQLVASAFGKNSRKGEESDYKNDIFSGFLRVLGFDSRRIGAIAVNAIIFVAQLITTSLSDKQKQRPKISYQRSMKGSPLEWALSSPHIIEMLPHIKDADLPAKVIQHVRENSLDEETGCIQLLMCKARPFVRGMQRALTEEGGLGTRKGKGVFYEFLPTWQQWEHAGDKCDEEYPYCTVLL